MGTPPTVARAIWAQFSYFLRILRNSQNLSESSKNRQTGSLAADWTRLGGVGLPVAEWGRQRVLNAHLVVPKSPLYSEGLPKTRGSTPVTRRCPEAQNIQHRRTDTPVRNFVANKAIV